MNAINKTERDLSVMKHPKKSRGLDYVFLQKYPRVLALSIKNYNSPGRILSVDNCDVYLEVNGVDVCLKTPPLFCSCLF